MPHDGIRHVPPVAPVARTNRQPPTGPAMNYRHAYHAGNHADVVKHSVLLALCEALVAKPSP